VGPPRLTRVLAISDLHVGYAANRAALADVPGSPDDWLIVAGDIGERIEQVEETIAILRPRYGGLIWVPGNHELWSMRSDGVAVGAAKYERLVALCRRHGVLTPEDEYPVVESEGARYRLVPLFLLYDYTFRPPGIASAEAAIAWAAETGVVCTDEALLSPAPFPSREAWCRERVALTRARLDALDDTPMVLINHFPLRAELAVLPAIPRFSIWCGTTSTEDWHTRYPVAAVVYGHLHIRATRWIDGVRFEEVSLGAPGQWRPELGLAAHLRVILPPASPPADPPPRSGR
jgi:3',5'-cyclic AMP phosphodiesterase CpdA